MVFYKTLSLLLLIREKYKSNIEYYISSSTINNI